jgi:SAM-dependent methyltransferase
MLSELTPHLYGIEIDPIRLNETLALLKKRHRRFTMFFLGDFFKPFPLGNFDAVCSFGFIEHFDDSKLVVDKHVEILKEGGHLIITVPNIKARVDLRRRPGINVKILELKGFRELFGRGDLEEIYCGYFGWREIYHNGFLFRVLERLMNLLIKLPLTDERASHLLYIGEKRGLRSEEPS